MPVDRRTADDEYLFLEYETRFIMRSQTRYVHHDAMTYNFFSIPASTHPTLLWFASSNHIGTGTGTVLM